MSDSSISLTPGGNGANSANRSRTTGSQQASQSGSGTGQEGSKAVERENISQEDLEESAELLNKSAEILEKDIRFNVVPSEDVIQAEIRNRENDEVIRKIPPDRMIELRKKIDSFIGLFVDEER